MFERNRWTGWMSAAMVSSRLPREVNEELPSVRSRQLLRIDEFGTSEGFRDPDAGSGKES